MINVNCFSCREPLTEPGAILFGPPYTEGDRSQCRKIHICTKCFGPLYEQLSDSNFLAKAKPVVEQLGKETKKNRIGPFGDI